MKKTILLCKKWFRRFCIASLASFIFVNTFVAKATGETDPITIEEPQAYDYDFLDPIYIRKFVTRETTTPIYHLSLSRWVQAKDGNAYDIDGYYGDQCWDLWAKYCVDTGLYKKFDYGCMGYGYAYGVFKAYKKSGASKYFEKVKASAVQPGDWIFWDRNSSCPLSHVALLLKNNSDGTGVFLSQTRGEGTRIVTLKMDILGGFRPKGDYSWNGGYFE